MMMTESYYRLYEMALPLVAVENLVMGITLSILCLAKKYGRLHNRSGLIFLAMVMLSLSAINVAEYTVGIYEGMTNKTLAVVICAASIELFLFFFTYVSMLDKSFVTRKRIMGELAMIVLFTTPSFWVQDIDSALFWVLLGIAFAFYVVKLVVNFIIYRRYLRQTISRIEDYLSHDSLSLLAWINRTFYATMAVGVVSIFAPMGGYRELLGYNLFVAFAYLYIYIEVILNIYVFDGSMVRVYEPQTEEFPTNESQEGVENEVYDANKEPSSIFMNPRRQMIYQEWIDRKGYTDPCVTADNIALLLNTNRSRLSLYLNNELGMNYYEWIAHLRIEDAKKLLIEEPETPICNIAVRIGIEDKSNFGRAFRRVTGVSPTRYRNDYFANK